MVDLATIDRPAELAELFDTTELLGVLQSFAELHQVGIVVSDRAGAVVAQAGGAQPLCELVRHEPAGAGRCTAKLAEVCGAEIRDGVRAIDCFNGYRYLVAPLRHEGNLLGRLVFGPYRPSERPAVLTGMVQGLLGRDLDAAERALGAARALADDEARRAVANVLEIFDALVHASRVRRMMSEVHLATVKEAYDDLVTKNRRLSAAVARLTEADKLKSSFLATVSHELRTPLTSVIGYSEMLLEGLAGALNDEQREYVRTIMDKGEQLLVLISGILDVSRIAGGSLELFREEVDLTEILSVVSTTVSGQARRKQLHLELRVEQGLPRLTGDREKLRLVVLNLLSNAVKFTPEGGRIDVVLRRAMVAPRGLENPLDPDAPPGRAGEDGRPIVEALELAVGDNGIGIPPDVHQRIFEAFFQVDSSSTREHGGTGLGLALVKSFTEAHGGAVWVESDLGHGATFHVWLPLDAALPIERALEPASVETEDATTAR